MTHARAPLESIRVLDISTLFPAGYLAAQLGQLGADVVKIEPPDGDPLRRTGVFRGGVPTVWAVAGRGKRSVVIDFDDPHDLERLQALACVSDIVVTNQPANVLDRWGCSYEALREWSPGLIMVSVTGFGADGPLADRAASGTLAEAFAGLTGLLGEVDGPPELLAIPLGDCMGAMAGTTAALAALFSRAHDGQGQFVDVALYEAVLPLLATSLAAWSPGSPPPRRTGGRVPGAAPRNTYRARDGRWVALSGATDAQTRRILAIVGAGPVAEERLATSMQRDERHAELDRLIGAWVAARDAKDAAQTLADARVPATVVHDLADVVAHSHVLSRESIVQIDVPGAGAVRQPRGVPWRAESRGNSERRPPAIGEHTAEVLREWLAS